MGYRNDCGQYYRDGIKMERIAQEIIKRTGYVIGIVVILLLIALNVKTFPSFREWYAFIFMPGAIFLILMTYNFITYSMSKYSMNGNTEQEILRNRARSKQTCIRFSRGITVYGVGIVLWYMLAFIGSIISNLPQF